MGKEGDAWLTSEAEADCSNCGRPAAEAVKDQREDRGGRSDREQREDRGGRSEVTVIEDSGAGRGSDGHNYWFENLAFSYDLR